MKRSQTCNNVVAFRSSPVMAFLSLPAVMTSSRRSISSYLRRINTRNIFEHLVDLFFLFGLACRAVIFRQPAVGVDVHPRSEMHHLAVDGDACHDRDGTIIADFAFLNDENYCEGTFLCPKPSEAGSGTVIYGSSSAAYSCRGRLHVTLLRLLFSHRLVKLQTLLAVLRNDFTHTDDPCHMFFELERMQL